MIDSIEGEMELLQERLHACEAEAEEIQERLQGLEEKRKAYWELERKEANRSYERSV